jgi:3-hydroxyisobutyrate dehydrogenase-like beta-hydroxyacid dehydrogenase
MTDAPDQHLTLGFIGLGSMGSRMATRLLQAGHSVVVYDTDAAASRALEERGATRTESPHQVADKAATVLVSVPSPEISRDVALGQSGLIRGKAIKTYVDVSTTGPTAAAEIAAELGQCGISCIDAPVSGGPGGAEAGTLTFMVSGDPSEIDCVRPIFNVLGSRILQVGEHPGQAQSAKVINNLLMAGALVLTGEAVSLGVKAGIDAETLLDIIDTSTGQNNAASTKFPRQVLTRKFAHGFRLGLLVKDLRLCLDEARTLGVPMPVGTTVEQIVEISAAQSQPDADCTEVVRIIEGWAGVAIEKQTQR